MFQLECKLLIPLIYCLSKISNELTCEITDQGCTLSACDEGRTVFAVCTVSPNILIVINEIRIKSFTVNSVSFYNVVQHFDSLYLEIEEDFINFKNMTQDTIFSLPQIQAEKLQLEYSKLNLSGFAKILPHLNWSLLLNSPFLLINATLDDIHLTASDDTMTTKITINPHDCDAFESSILECNVPMPIFTQIMHLGHVVKKSVSWYFQSGEPMVLSLNILDAFDLDVIVSINEQYKDPQKSSPGQAIGSPDDHDIATAPSFPPSATQDPRPLKKMRYQ